MKQIRIAVLAGVFIALSVVLSGCMNSAGFETLKASDLQKMLNSGEKFSLVDIREASDYKRGHINAAINIPMSKFEENYTQLKPDSKVVLICYTGHTSQAAAQFLLKKGFTKVSSVEGGMDRWSGPVTK